MQKKDLRSISLSEWKAKSKKTEFHKLPSGVTVELKRLSLIEQVSIGNLPLEMFNTAMEASNKMAKGGQKVSIVELSNMTNLINSITVLSLVNPPVTIEDVGEIPFNDRQAIFVINSSEAGAPDLLPFPEE